MEYVWVLFVTLGCSRSSCSDSSLPGSPRIRLFVLQQSACGIGYTPREGEEKERKKGREGRRATDWKQKRLSSFFFVLFHFHTLSCAAEI